MILKALYDYYHRSGDLAPVGMEDKEITYLIVIDKDGTFIRIEDRRIDAKSSSKFQVLKGVNRTSAPNANILWDNVEYVLNYTKHHPELTQDDAENIKKVEIRETNIQNAKIKNQLFIKRCDEISRQFPHNIGFKAISLFYKREELNNVFKSPLWESISKKPTVNISFLLQGETQIIAEHEDLRSLINLEFNKNDSKDLSTCLITGEKDSPVQITTATAIPGGQATGKLVAFQIKSGYDSYGKSKGLNAPISKEAEASFTTALNKMLAKGSQNKFTIGNRTFLFWASSSSTTAREAEQGIFNLFGFAEKETDQPDRRIEQVRKVFNAIFSGHLRTNLDDRFYFLGLAPNSARIAVVYWKDSYLRDFAGHIKMHFDDMEIIDVRNNKKPYSGLYHILSSVTLNGKTANVQPNLPESVMESMLQGTSYPYTLFMACINRIRAEQQVSIGRAAIIKAYLNRLNNNTKKINIMIDKENSNMGYLCGRLFATLEHVQERSSNNNSIRNRYMNAASTTPATVFSTILNLSVHHAEKLSKSSQVFFEQVKTEIMDKMPADGFPAHLDLADQGRFMIGYYHQRSDFYTKKDNDIK